MYSPARGVVTSVQGKEQAQEAPSSFSMDDSTLQLLLRPDAFDHPAGQPQLRATHISWVILAGDFAYKIKKPVDFGFLDFSTLALRHFYCEQELALNRRFARELYLAVVPVTQGPDGPGFGGTGAVIDYAVKMRRFDEDGLLSHIAERGALERPLVRALAREIAALQAEAPTCHPPAGSEEPGTPAALLAAMRQNFQQARDYDLAAAELRQLAAVERWTLQRHTALLALLQARVVDGWIIDGHGDAHLGNIVLIDGAVRLFDCIEFNPALRIMDSIGEIALLGMDLDARGCEAQAHWLLADYLEYRGDYAGLELLNLYRSYFALVRAKVALLREPVGHPAITRTAAYTEFCRYLALALRYCEQPAPFLAITHGVSGSGKSTIADQLVGAGGALRIRSDVERKRLFGLAPEQRSKAQDNARLYSSAMSRKTFERLEQLAAQGTAAGFSVIVDATFLHRRTRDDFRALARRLDLPFVIIDCSAPPDALRQRLLERERHRQDASEAGVQVMEQQLQVDQPLSDAELPYRMEASSGEDGGALWQRLVQHCRR